MAERFFSQQHSKSPQISGLDFRNTLLNIALLILNYIINIKMATGRLRTRSVDQQAEGWTSVGGALGPAPNHIPPSGGGDRRIRSSRLSLATQWDKNQSTWDITSKQQQKPIETNIRYLRSHMSSASHCWVLFCSKSICVSLWVSTCLCMV